LFTNGTKKASMQDAMHKAWKKLYMKTEMSYSLSWGRWCCNLLKELWYSVDGLAYKAVRAAMRCLAFLSFVKCRLKPWPRPS
jgi:uncharacterized membrane protein YcjF (UPF0283 family)